MDGSDALLHSDIDEALEEDGQLGNFMMRVPIASIMTVFVIMFISGCESKLRGDVAYFGFNCGDEATVVEVERSNRRVHFEVIDTPAGIARTLAESPSWAEIIKFTPDHTARQKFPA
jgi:hypothetical protein